MKILTRFFTAMLILTIAVILVACGNTNDTSDTNKSNDKQKVGGELNIGLASNAATLDPVLYTGKYESQIMRQIGETLIQYDLELEETKPLLATEWEISDDLKEYTFKLRDDVFFQKGEFQDGRKMDAEDVKYSLERSAKESVQNRLTGVKQVDVVDDYTVKIILEEPNAALLNMLMDSGNMIVPKEEVEGYGNKFGSNIVGTGPFTLEKFTTGSDVKLVRNEEYWGETPNLDKVNFKFITDESMMGNALRTGDIDIATDISGQNREIISKSDGMELVKTPGLSITYLDMNNKEGPTSDPKVREAIVLATNVEDVVSGVHQWGGAEPGFEPLPRGSWGYSKELESKRQYDPEKAKKILSETEYKDGFSIDVYLLDTRKEYATIFQNQMKENLNIDVNINVTEWGTLVDLVSKGKAPMNIGGWSWYPDPYFFLDQRFHSNNIGSNGNGKGYDNPEVDKLLDRARQETIDQEERTKLYQEAMEIILEDYPSVELDNLEIAFGVSDKVQGFELPADGNIVLVSSEVNVSVDK